MKYVVDHRSSVLRLNGEGSDPSPSLVCRGPENVLSVLNGGRIEEGVKLAGLLFPICPRAHHTKLHGSEPIHAAPGKRDCASALMRRMHG